MKKTLYAQLAVVWLFFALMVISSYYFISKIEYKHLRQQAEDMLSLTQARVEGKMLETEAALDGISLIVRRMILNGADAGAVLDYLTEASGHLLSGEGLTKMAGAYGYFDAFGGLFLNGSGWVPPDDYVPLSQLWYTKTAAEDDSKTVTIDTTNEPVIIFAKRIFDDKSNLLGVVCLDIPLGSITKYIVSGSIVEGGYGVMLDENMKLIAHRNPEEVGKMLREMSGGGDIEDDLKRGLAISEHELTSHSGMPSIVFFKQIVNGWYVGILTPKAEYYQSLNRIAFILVLLGVVMAGVLTIILLRIVGEKRKSDERMQAMLDATPLIANVWNKKLQNIDCNQEAVRVFGCSDKKEYLDKFFELSPKYQQDGKQSCNKMTEVLNKTFANGYYRLEWMHQKLNGELIPCEITLVRIKLDDDYFVATYTRDLREIKAAMAKIREADERTQLMLDSTPIGASFWNRELKNIDCNREAVRLFQLSSKHEFLERFHELSPERQPDGRLSSERSIELVGKAFEEGYCRFEWMHQKTTGEPIPCEITLVRVKFRDDYIVVGYTRDLREMKTITAKIIDERVKFETMAHWYKSILDAVPLPISVTDANTNWTFINSRVEKFLNVCMKDIIGKPCSNWGANICNTANCGIECAKRGLLKTYFTHNGSSYQVDVEILKNIKGDTAGYIEVVQDVTRMEELAKRQMEAETISQAKSSFLATMSHEIRTPLNAILGITDIQIQDHTITQNTREALIKIHNSGDLLLHIINDILDLSKIESGKLELIPIKYDVPSLINDTVHLNLIHINDKPIEFELRVMENIPSELFGDELRIKQILGNLLSNAFKYTERGNVVLLVEAESGNDKSDIILIFKISDTGQGMSAEEVSNLFNEYSRFRMEANRTTEGAGLGMSITKQLIRLMNGEIYVDSELDKGSTFTVRLPQKGVGSGLIDRDLADNLQQFRFDSTPLMRKIQITREPMPYGNVLIVDDVETNLYVAKGLMALYSLKIDLVTSGYEAIEKIKQGNVYDVVFMDHMMPKMDGIEAVKHIREMGYTEPIVALTANAVAGQAEIFMNNGFDDFISKPIDVRQLNVSLNRFIRDKQPPEVIEKARQEQLEQEQNATGRSTESVGVQLAEIFIRDAEKALSALEMLLENNFRRNTDMQIYIINVHAMKSALANIGEAELSSAALKLEQAGREGNITVMKTELPAFLHSLRKVIEKIRPEDDNTESIDENTSEGHAYLYENLRVVQKACMDYDKKTAKNTLSELREKAWSLKTKELLSALAEHLLHSEFDEAAVLCKNALEE